MKFPRNARVFRGNFDVTPYASVFFLLVIFVLLGSLVYTPGVRLNLPVADGLPGTDKPTVSVAVDSVGRLYFRSQLIEEAELRKQLMATVRNTPELALVIQADKSVAYDNLIRLALLARDTGIRDVLLATLPRTVAVASPAGRLPEQ
jgi:biopolymer transport protein ExbD